MHIHSSSLDTLCSETAEKSAPDIEITTDAALTGVCDEAKIRHLSFTSSNRLICVNDRDSRSTFCRANENKIPFLFSGFGNFSGERCFCLSSFGSITCIVL